jgi:hypothetical protein
MNITTCSTDKRTPFVKALLRRAFFYLPVFLTTVKKQRARIEIQPRFNPIFYEKPLV